MLWCLKGYHGDGASNNKAADKICGSEAMLKNRKKMDEMLHK